MLEIDRLSVAYGDALALDQVSLRVGEGQVVAVIGANGAGKTTLIRAIAGILPCRGGRIRYRGQDITGLPPHTVCNLGIGQVAEGRQIFASLSVRQNLEVGAMLPRARAGCDKNRKLVLDIFPRLRERWGQAAGTLSGGEQQMLAIGRCLMGGPDLIMFDEPSLGLAPRIVAEVFHTVQTLSRSGRTIILVEQNVAASLGLADVAYVLENGRITLSGSGAELLHDPRVRQAYLGV